MTRWGLSGIWSEAIFSAADCHHSARNPAISSAAPGRAQPRPGAADEIAGLRAEWWQSAAEKMASDQMPLKPHRVMAALSRVLPDDAVVVADAGTPTPYLCAYYDVHRAGRQ